MLGARLRHTPRRRSTPAIALRARTAESAVPVSLHYTDTPLEPALRILTQQEVTAHYLVSATTIPPSCYRLVDEDRRAWHAGQSYWQGATMLNSASIGIEIVNPGRRVAPRTTEIRVIPRADRPGCAPCYGTWSRPPSRTRPDRASRGHDAIAPQRRSIPAHPSRGTCSLRAGWSSRRAEPGRRAVGALRSRSARGHMVSASAGRNWLRRA